MTSPGPFVSSADPSGLIGRVGIHAFAHPQGILGRLGGTIMSQSQSVQRWMVDLLKLKPTDRVLEIGSGPGVALALAAERVPHGHVTGLDLSRVMVAQARRRNRTAVAAGRVDVGQGDTASLPFPAGSFSKICTINCLPFWPSVPDGLAEVRRVLAPEGLAVVAVRLYREGVSRANPSAYGFTDEQLAILVETIERAGLARATVHRRQWPRETIAAVAAYA